MRRAFAYLRVSGRGQVGGDGFTRQLKAIRDYAKAHNIRIARIFREEGISGATDLQNRPALSDLLEALHSNGVKLVLVERLDRLARDVVIQEAILRDLRRHSFELISVKDPELVTQDDPDEPSRRLIRVVLGAIAEYEKSLIVIKLRGARARKRARSGRCEGRKPFGTRPGERRAIERMRALRDQGLGFDRIAAELNREGVKTRQGGRWHGLVVNRILSRQS